MIGLGSDNKTSLALQNAPRNQDPSNQTCHLEITAHFLLVVFSKMIPTSHTVNMSFSITIQQQQQDSEDNLNPIFV